MGQREGTSVEANKTSGEEASQSVKSP